MVDEQGVQIRFVGVHPTPPVLRKGDEDAIERHDSRIRDADLLLIAKEIAGDPEPRWIVAADFNDVAWSRTTREFQRVSGLGDPRVGRAMLNTYHAQKPFWRYPIDHSFVSPGLRIDSLARIVIPGSDHFAVKAGFDISRLKQPLDAEPAGDQVEQVIEDGIEDANR